ncbi:MAG TPA: hypothetical protein VFW45_03695 [Candidatus Polarisedimenticolia bacterium]|nr:hypothetical protein [Candidatus Polarisedimenticolia bacterium]
MRICLAVMALVAAEGCSRSPLLVEGPVDLGPSPIVTRFERPMRVSGARWEICFEFDRPGDSHDAEAIDAVLLADSGQRHPLVDSELDRRGEATVCRIGRIDAWEPGGRIEPEEKELRFVAVELSSAKWLRLRQIRGGSAS